ncbi:MAG: hypothetical protein IH800_07975 [Myxococcales bacterium]|nr:hypothetical protein [Myxococcales bacterium]
MANSALVVVGSDEPRPFMRGILVQSLVSRGVPFDVALETANEIRGRLANQEEVALHDLSKLVEELLADRYDLEALPLPPAQAPPQVSGPRGTSSPFSKGVLAVSLQGAGLDPNDAYDVARELEVRLLREARRSIDRVALRDLVSETIERTHGSKAAERYRVWRQALEDGRPIFLLLGGSTGVGKTSIAVEVARRLEISRVIGTDSIRQIMRLMFSADLMPEIHCSTYDAYRALHLEWPVEGGDVIVGFREQAQKIVVGVHALLDRAVEENVSMMVEGVNLLPGVLHLDRYRENAHVIFLVVATLDSKAYAARFQSRAATARERGADRYLRFMDEIRSIQDHVLAEAEQLGLPIIDNVRLDDAVLSVTRSVISTLKKSMSDAVDEGAS